MKKVMVVCLALVLLAGAVAVAQVSGALDGVNIPVLSPSQLVQDENNPSVEIGSEFNVSEPSSQNNKIDESATDRSETSGELLSDVSESSAQSQSSESKTTTEKKTEKPTTSEALTAKGPLDVEDENLILVNSKHEYKGKPKELVKIYDYKTSTYLVKDKNVLLEKRVMDSLNKMMDDFYAKTKIGSVNIITAYRSRESQKEIYDSTLKSRGKEYTEKYVQKPGYSEHETGLAFDLGIYHTETGKGETFTGEGEYSWFSENAWRYGFILRYPKDKEKLTGIAYEAWHFRFVGKENAKYIYDNKLCLEEAIG